MQDALKELWPFTEDLLMYTEYEVKDKWKHRVDNILNNSNLEIPEDVQMITGGREGKHSEHLYEMLEEMQFMQRTYPGAEW